MNWLKKFLINLNLWPELHNMLTSSYLSELKDFQRLAYDSVKIVEAQLNVDSTETEAAKMIEEYLLKRLKWSDFSHCGYSRM